jgi:hypothetical protein
VKTGGSIESARSADATPFGFGGGLRYRGWRWAGLDFFGTPGSIDQISDPDQAFLTTAGRVEI